MENKPIVLEHANMMYYTRELVDLKVPKELNLTFYSVLIFFIIVFTGIFFIKINDVVKVQGIVRSEGNNSEVRNVIPGKITSINYKANQFVNKGDTLLTIDDSQYLANINQLTEELFSTTKDLNFHNALLNAIQNGKEESYEDEFIEAKINDYFASLAYLTRQVDAYAYEYNFQKNLPETLQTEKSLKQAEYQLRIKKDELNKFKSDTLAQLLENQKTLNLKINSLNQEKAKLDNQFENLCVKAPVSGYVQELSSLNIGDFITQNHTILKIVPLENKNFKVELAIPTKDIGELSEGMEVKYRLSAFPFFEYRGANGKITAIDPDIRLASNKLVYCVYSDIDKTSFTNYQGREYPLRSGIEVDARIVMEKISIAAYIFRKMGFIK